jgi:endonuclease-8
MPEGPEIRRAADALGRVLTRRTLIYVEYRIPRLARKARALRGAKVNRVRTRGKALLIEFDRGLTHFSHNQLYGEWEVTAGARTQDERRTVRVVLATAKHTATLYSATDIELLDTRKVDRHPYLAKLGPDVLNSATTVATIEARLADPRFAGRSLAGLLLDQRFVAGLGNYLRSDILFTAGLAPDARPRDLTDSQRARLVKGMLRLARQSYRTGGVTNDPARARASARTGVAYEDYRFLVYGREGAPCWTCGTKIARHDAGGRGLFLCATCQSGRAASTAASSEERCGWHQNVSAAAHARGRALRAWPPARARERLGGSERSERGGMFHPAGRKTSSPGDEPIMKTHDEGSQGTGTRSAQT